MAASENAPEPPVTPMEQDNDADHSPMLVALVAVAVSGFVVGVGIGIVLGVLVL
jgi:F0F1-type ATP synthase assembly protein I